MPWIKVNSEPPKPTTFEDLGYVKVVRCKDCKHYDRDENCRLGTCLENGVRSTPDWFCADGERSVK